MQCLVKFFIALKTNSVQQHKNENLKMEASEIGEHIMRFQNKQCKFMMELIFLISFYFHLTYLVSSYHLEPFAAWWLQGK